MNSSLVQHATAFSNFFTSSLRGSVKSILIGDVCTWHLRTTCAYDRGRIFGIWSAYCTRATACCGRGVQRYSEQKNWRFMRFFFQTKEALQLLKLVYTVHGKLRVTCKIQFWQNYGPNPLFITYMLTLSSRQLQLAQSRSENREHPTATQDVIHGHLRTSAAIPCGIWSWVPLEADPSMLRGYQSSGCQNTSVALWHNGFWVGLTADFGNNHKETTLRFKMMLYHLMNRQNRTNKMEKKTKYLKTMTNYQLKHASAMLSQGAQHNSFRVRVPLRWGSTPAVTTISRSDRLNLGMHKHQQTQTARNSTPADFRNFSGHTADPILIHSDWNGFSAPSCKSNHECGSRSKIPRGKAAP